MLMVTANIPAYSDLHNMVHTAQQSVEVCASTTIAMYMYIVLTHCNIAEIQY